MTVIPLVVAAAVATAATAGSGSVSGCESDDYSPARWEYLSLPSPRFQISFWSLFLIFLACPYQCRILIFLVFVKRVCLPRRGCDWHWRYIDRLGHLHSDDAHKP